MRETARLASQWKLNYKMPKYRKLVRDRIPEIIKENGGVPQTRILTKKEFKEELLKKLVEEAKEAYKSKEKDGLISELADIQEVLLSVYEIYSINCSDVTKTARKKRKERGAFNKRVYLESVK